MVNECGYFLIIDRSHGGRLNFHHGFEQYTFPEIIALANPNFFFPMYFAGAGKGAVETTRTRVDLVERGAAAHGVETDGADIPLRYNFVWGRWPESWRFGAV